MAAMEKRGLHPALGTFKEVESITPNRLRDIVGYMDDKKYPTWSQNNCKRC